MIFKYSTNGLKIIMILFFLISYKGICQVTSLSIVNGAGEVGKGKDWKYGYQINALEFQKDWWPGISYGFAYYLAPDFKGGGGIGGAISSLKCLYMIPIFIDSSKYWFETRREGNISFGFWGGEMRYSVIPYLHFSISKPSDKYLEYGVVFNGTSDVGRNGFYPVYSSIDIGIKVFRPLAEGTEKKNYLIVFVRYTIGICRIIW